MPARQNGKEQPTTKPELWTPKKAEAALGRTKINRDISPMNVIKYARDMREGRWTFCPEPITFDTDGNLIDGQNRAAAQVESGATITWQVCRNVPAEVQKTINTGIPRSLGHLLQFKGVGSARNVGAVARLCLSMETGRIYMRKREQATSNTEIVEFFEKNPTIEHSSMLAQQVIKSGGLLRTMPSALGAAHWWIAQHVSIEEADAYLNRMSTHGGVNERDGSPVMALVNRLNRISDKKIRIEARWIVYMVLKCWNKDVLGQTVYTINAITKDGEYRLITPRAPGVDLSDGADDDEEADQKAS